jgi:hypothetical protein
MPIILAHGAVGPWDDILVVGIAIVFTGFMVCSWFKSRSFEPVLEDETESDEREI